MPRAIQLTNDPQFAAAVVDIPREQFPATAVSVVIEYSSLNFKDALAITNRSPVVRKWPMVAGIDGAGVVVESTDPRWKPGDRVVHIGWGAGETKWGCLAEVASLSGDEIVGLPSSMSTRQAMAIGTAGYTSMLCMMALQDHGIAPERGEILVTGATGGVGSVCIALLAKAGYRVVAATGKAAEAGYLRALGAADVIDRAGLATAGKPLQKERWAGVVDAAGSATLANALAQTQYGGAVAACGLVQGMDLPATVMPFILRGVSLLGIDSVMAPMEKRQVAWKRLASDLDLDLLESMIEEIPLDSAIEKAAAIAEGRQRGRVLVRVA